MRKVGAAAAACQWRPAGKEWIRLSFLKKVRFIYTKSYWAKSSLSTTSNCTSVSKSYSQPDSPPPRFRQPLPWAPPPLLGSPSCASAARPPPPSTSIGGLGGGAPLPLPAPPAAWLPSAHCGLSAALAQPRSGPRPPGAHCGWRCAYALGAAGRSIPSRACCSRACRRPAAPGVISCCSDLLFPCTDVLFECIENKSSIWRNFFVYQLLYICCNTS